MKGALGRVGFLRSLLGEACLAQEGRDSQAVAGKRLHSAHVRAHVYVHVHSQSSVN